MNRRLALLLLVLSVGCQAADESSVSSLALRQGRAPDPARELVIVDPSVIDSPEEITFDPRHPSGTSKKGAWSFGRLVHNMLPRHERRSPEAASRLVMRWLQTWLVDQSPNPAVSPARARASIRTLAIDPWKAASGCVEPANPETDATCLLDMRKAPFRLIAIVNRPDLRIVDAGARAIGGEGRFVFQLVGPTLAVAPGTEDVVVMDPAPQPQKFTVIFEYALPVRSNLETLQWARRWHALGEIPFGPRFNHALLQLTSDFSGPDVDARRPNGNALNQLRTNEVALMGARFPEVGFAAAKQFWELREFQLAADGLRPHTVNQEPARDFDVAKPGQMGQEGQRAAELAAFLVANADTVRGSRHDFGALGANSSLVGSAPYGAWGKLVNPNPPSVPITGVAHHLPGVPVDVRDSFALDTCAGCHRHETDTRHFMHLTIVAAMEPSSRVDDRARVGVGPETPEGAVVPSAFLREEISPGGDRFEDFVALLETPAHALRNRPGRRVCAR